MEATWGPALRRARESQGVSLRGLARRIGVGAPYLSRVERNEVPPPKRDVILRLAESLALDPDQLVTAAGKSDDHYSKRMQARIDRLEAEVGAMRPLVDLMLELDADQTVGLLIEGGERGRAYARRVILAMQALREARS